MRTTPFVQTLLFVAAALLPQVALAMPLSEKDTVHPWDVPSRRAHDRRTERLWSREDVDSYEKSRWRTQTHALHPYYRSTYPFMSDTEDLSAIQKVEFGSLYATRKPELGYKLCNNRQYVRENTWVPPYKFTCGK